MKHKHKFLQMGISFLIIFAITILLASCNIKETSNKKDSVILTIYTTVYPLQTFSEKIGGKYVHVQSIYPPGVDEHTYEPSQKDIIDIANSDLFFYIGYNLEGFVNKTKSIMEKEGVKVIATGELIHLDNEQEGHDHDDEQEGHDHGDENDGHDQDGEHDENEHDGHNHGSIDPHLWIDPLYAKQLAKVIFENISAKMPEQKEYFQKNYDELAENLQALHEKYVELSNNKKRSQFIVSHAAYGYWEKRYHLDQLSVSGISTSQEPSQKQLKEIIDTVKEAKLNYILVEQNINNRLVDVIRKEAGISSLPIHNLSVLTEKDIQAGEDYFSLMEKNLETLQKALND
ncbi:metal ABC transporter solute-binding protein, Zn/Mn family [Bacillus kwashiorkori]|uniref:metal ABC transporter solute-binding protein, Zn/Mn family n=1 Tax=Bacillus kwashiorkori TaxID=1522318 RepID=UPI000784184B|nr:zinc ABC transporter substrate-binding protein [Bacillus kwashiorkori]